MNDINRAAKAIAEADAILIGAGAGMGCDSGLPDFRGPEGFWKAYPPYAKLGLSFHDMANAALFRTAPHTAWGFYGHRLNLYRQTVPHRGFATLLEWAGRRPTFVYTSNVDGQFQKAGFKDIVEGHGSIHRLQCTRGCGIFPADPFEVTVDESTMKATDPLPQCRCGALARPNIMMFYDGSWDSGVADAQNMVFQGWLEEVGRLVILEFGAGTAIPAVRWRCERVAALTGATLIRVNPREPHMPRGHIGIPLTAVAAIDALRHRI